MRQTYTTIKRAHFPRALLLASFFLLPGCSTYRYEYVLDVRCEGRPIAGEPPWIRNVGLTPPVDVSVTCDGKTKRIQFDPMGQTRTIKFSESSRVMIDGGAILRGFSVHVRRAGYKDWHAEYNDDRHLMETESGTFVRLDSILLEPSDSDKSSRRLKGGPEEANSEPP